MQSIVVPLTAPVFSAQGILSADMRLSRQRSILQRSKGNANDRAEGLDGRAMEAVFAELPDEARGVSLTPFFLKDVVLDPSLMQADGLHPVAAAQTRMLDAVWPAIEAALKHSIQGTP